MPEFELERLRELNKAAEQDLVKRQTRAKRLKKISVVIALALLLYGGSILWVRLAKPGHIVRQAEEQAVTTQEQIVRSYEKHILDLEMKERQLKAELVRLQNQIKTLPKTSHSPGQFTSLQSSTDFEVQRGILEERFRKSISQMPHPFEGRGMTDSSIERNRGFFKNALHIIWPTISRLREFEEGFGMNNRNLVALELIKIFDSKQHDFIDLRYTNFGTIRLQNAHLTDFLELLTYDDVSSSSVLLLFEDCYRELLDAPDITKVSDDEMGRIISSVAGKIENFKKQVASR